MPKFAQVRTSRTFSGGVTSPRIDAIEARRKGVLDQRMVEALVVQRDPTDCTAASLAPPKIFGQKESGLFLAVVERAPARGAPAAMLPPGSSAPADRHPGTDQLPRILLADGLISRAQHDAPLRYARWHSLLSARASD